jgi:biotin carboxyl carrier protein
MNARDGARRAAWRVALAPTSAHAGLEPIEVQPDTDETRVVSIDSHRVRIVEAGEHAARHHEILLGPSKPAGSGRRGALLREVVVDGWRVEVELEAAVHAALRERAHRGDDETSHGGPTEVRAIIPGVVVSVSVNPGDEVVTGQEMLVVEAMKMQNELRAPRDGRVERVAVGPGKTIELGELLLVIV